MGCEIKNTLLGKECNKCEDQGVNCSQVGVFTLGVPAEIGNVAIFLNGNPVLRTPEKIKDCPVIIGTKSKNEVVKKINS